MRFLYAAAATLLASLVLAQENNVISIPEGQSTLEVTAGQPTTIEWTNPSSGTVTIKIQQSGNNITPESGIVVASNIPASDGTATFTVQPDQVNSFQYTIEIIDDTDPTNYNFSPNFGIVGATSTATDNSSVAASTGSATSAATDSSATNSTATTTVSDSSSTESSSATSTESESSSETTSSAAASESTSAPSSDDNGAAGLRVQGGLVAAIAVAVAVL